MAGTQALPNQESKNDGCIRGGCEFSSGICEKIGWCLIIRIKGESVCGVKDKGINTREREKTRGKERKNAIPACVS